MTEKTKEIDKKFIRARMLSILCWRFPKAFFPLNEPAKPLKINIIKDILATLKKKPQNCARDLKIFLSWYTSQKYYLQALLSANSKRINLEGDELEEVLERHRERAKFELEKKLQEFKNQAKTKEEN
jgi:sRNA-binding protein